MSEKIVDVTSLRGLSPEELFAYAVELGISHPAALKKSDVIFAIMKILSQSGQKLQTKGVIETTQDGFGFLRFQENNFLPGPDDIYVPPSVIRGKGLKTGVEITVSIRKPKNNERFFSVDKVLKLEGDQDQKKRMISFDNCTPLYPDSPLTLEVPNSPPKSAANSSMRVIDIVTPIGKGQRALIVAPPRSGKTVLLQNIAQSIEHNHPDVHLMILLIDERPEEVTDMARTVKSPVISSTFDEPAQRHTYIAEMVIERAKRMAEQKKDVVILLDSITRLARAYNTVTPSSGKVLTGGLDANALQKPKRFLGAARNIENGGSLTIIATALLETGSKADDVIFEEFKGTGNSEICLDRRLAQKGIYPAIDVARSGTRKDNLLVSPENHTKNTILRRILLNMGAAEGMEFLLQKVQGTKDNSEFYRTMNS